MKTMTKEQAFGFLKGKKTFLQNKEQSQLVQKKLFEIGFELPSGNKKVEHTGDYFLFMGEDGCIRYGGDDTHAFYACKDGFVLPFDILEIKVEDKKEEYQFKVGEWVLVKDEGDESWEIAQFAYCITHHSGDKEYHTFGGNCYCECIPYAGNECLTGNWDLRNSQHK